MKQILLTFLAVAAACYKPTVYRDVKNNMWHLWYNGRPGGDEYIGYVTHEGLDITKQL